MKSKDVFKFLILTILFLTIFMFIVGCQTDNFKKNDKIVTLNNESILENESIVDIVNGNQSSDNLNQIKDNDQYISDVTETNCISGWKCVSSSLKAYRYSDCNWSEKIKCPLGCDLETDNCKKAELCEEGYFCKNNKVRAYKISDCIWTKEIECEWGCENATCKDKPNATETTGSVQGNDIIEEVDVENKKSINYIAFGEKTIITVGDQNYNFSIYNMDAEKVRVQLEDFKSDWLSEGQKVIFSSGVKITVEEILFQAYAGGKRIVGYIIE